MGETTEYAEPFEATPEQSEAAAEQARDEDAAAEVQGDPNDQYQP